MKTYQHILVPIDFSAGSEKILKQAQSMLQTNTKLTLINYVEPLPATCYGDVVGEIEENLETQAQQRIHQFALSHDIPKENTRIELGHAKSNIPLLAKELNADLIVIGNHGHHSRLSNLLLGSTTSRVVYHSPCDVFVVHT